MNEKVNELVALYKKEKETRLAILTSELNNNENYEIVQDRYICCVNDLTGAIYSIIASKQVIDVLNEICTSISNSKSFSDTIELSTVMYLISSFQETYEKSKVNQVLKDYLNGSIKLRSDNVVNEEILTSLYIFMKDYLNNSSMSAIEKLYFIDFLNGELDKSVSVRLLLANREAEASLYSSAEMEFENNANRIRKSIVMEKMKDEIMVISNLKDIHNRIESLDSEDKAFVNYSSARLAMYFIYLKSCNIELNESDMAKLKGQNESEDLDIILSRASQIYESVLNRNGSKLRRNKKNVDVN